MTPEERKAIAMRLAGSDGDNWRLYPKCCNYHEGFDDALGMLEQVDSPANAIDRLVGLGARLYAVEATP